MSEELQWELYDIFASGIFAFPVYEHSSARRIVRYLLMRGVPDEDVANAIEGHTLDLRMWMSRSGKRMVGEWVIAWLNERREDYKYGRHRGRFKGLAEGWEEDGGAQSEFIQERRYRRRHHQRESSSRRQESEGDGEEVEGSDGEERGSDESSQYTSTYRGSVTSLSSGSSTSSFRNRSNVLDTKSQRGYNTSIVSYTRSSEGFCTEESENVAVIETRGEAEVDSVTSEIQRVFSISDGSDMVDVGPEICETGSNVDDVGSNIGDLGPEMDDVVSNIGSNADDIGSNTCDMGSDISDVISNTGSNLEDVGFDIEGSIIDDFQSSSDENISLAEEQSSSDTELANLENISVNTSRSDSDSNLGHDPTPETKSQRHSSFSVINVSPKFSRFIPHCSSAIELSRSAMGLKKKKTQAARVLKPRGTEQLDRQSSPIPREESIEPEPIERGRGSGVWQSAEDISEITVEKYTQQEDDTYRPVAKLCRCTLSHYLRKNCRNIMILNRSNRCLFCRNARPEANRPVKDSRKKSKKGKSGSCMFWKVPWMV